MTKNPRAELAQHFYHSVAQSNQNSLHYLCPTLEQIYDMENIQQPQMLEAGHVAGNYISEYLWSLFRLSDGPLQWQVSSFKMTDMWHGENVHKDKSCNESKYLRKAKYKRRSDKRIALHIASLMISCRERIDEIVEFEYGKENIETDFYDWQLDTNTALVFERLPKLSGLGLNVILPLQLGYFFVRMKEINDLLFLTWHPNLLIMIRQAQPCHWKLFESEVSVEQLATALASDRPFPIELLQLILSFDECRDPELPMKRLLSMFEFRRC
jgi:hypothetical protein